MGYFVCTVGVIMIGSGAGTKDFFLVFLGMITVCLGVLALTVGDISGGAVC